MIGEMIVFCALDTILSKQHIYTADVDAELPVSSHDLHPKQTTCQSKCSQQTTTDISSLYNTSEGKASILEVDELSKSVHGGIKQSGNE